MQESYEKDLADHFGLNSYADGGNVVGVASGRGTGRLWLLNSESSFSCADLVVARGRRVVKDQYRRATGIGDLTAPLQRAPTLRV